MTETERVDEIVGQACVALARWLAVPPEVRRATIRRFAIEMRDRISARHESVGELLSASPLAGDRIIETAGRVLAMLDRDDDMTSIGFRPGICAVLHSTPDRTIDLACVVLTALLHDSVVVVISDAMSTVSLRAGRRGATDTALPPATISWLPADRESVDALVSNPLVATVLVDGDPADVERVRSIATIFGKPVIRYPEYEAFR